VTAYTPNDIYPGVMEVPAFEPPPLFAHSQCAGGLSGFLAAKKPDQRSTRGPGPGIPDGRARRTALGMAVSLERTRQKREGGSTPENGAGVGQYMPGLDFHLRGGAEWLTTTARFQAHKPGSGSRFAVA
jgi:hypothetical protein